MLINNVKFIAQSTEPNPNEVDYWINTSVDPNGGLIMFHDGEAWHPVNEKHDLFQEELIREEVERAKTAEAVLDQKITTETSRATAAEKALLDEMNDRIYAINSSSFNTVKFKEMQEALDDGAVISIDGEVCTFIRAITNGGKYEYTFDSYSLITAANSYIKMIVTTYLVKEQGSVAKQGDEEVLIAYNGDGTKFLADDGSYKQLESSTTTTSVVSLPITSNMIIATISAAGSFSLASTPAAGKEIHVIVKNSSTSDVTVTLPTASPYVCISSDSLTVPASGYAEVNAISDGTNIYLRAL